MNGYLTDYHCHSTASPDGQNTMSEMAEAGIALGLNELCFTDHVETFGFRRWNEGVLAEHSYDWSAMLLQFREAQERFGTRIRLRMGAELGEASYAPAVMDSFLDDAPPLDFTLGSVHIFRDAENGCLGDLAELGTDDPAVWHRAVTSYFDEMERLVEWGRFSVLAHLTLPQRYAKEKCGYALDMTPYTERIESVLRRAIDRGIGIECNTNRARQCLPDAPWLKLYRALGGELVTLGSDAHSPKYLGCAMAQTQELLKDCGFRYFAAFTGGRPEFHRL